VPTAASTPEHTPEPTAPSNDLEFFQFQSRPTTPSLCLHIRKKKLAIKTCNRDSTKQFWLIGEDSFLKNKDGKYVNNELKLRRNPGTFDENDFFVYNKFHETIIQGNLKLIYLDNGDVKSNNLLETGDLNDAVMWKVVM